MTTPVDPESLDATRPADLDACGTCGGTGTVPTGDWNQWRREYDHTECPDCGGTGVAP